MREHRTKVVLSAPSYLGCTILYLKNTHTNAYYQFLSNRLSSCDSPFDVSFISTKPCLYPVLKIYLIRPDRYTYSRSIHLLGSTSSIFTPGMLTIRIAQPKRPHISQQCNSESECTTYESRPCVSIATTSSPAKCVVVRLGKRRQKQDCTC